jgi:hypothetical protein
MFLLKKIFSQCEFREYQLNKNYMKLMCKSDIYGVFEKFITTLEQGDINSPETAYEILRKSCIQINYWFLL